jgi:hypothetical protein
MTYRPGSDPLEKIRGESSPFNAAWLRYGEKLTLTQRIGFTVFSLAFFGVGSLIATWVVQDLLNGELLGAAGWLLPALVFLVPGILGLRNVLRF